MTNIYKTYKSIRSIFNWAVNLYFDIFSAGRLSHFIKSHFYDLGTVEL